MPQLRARPRQLAVQPDRLLRARHRLIATAHRRQHAGKVVERQSQIGRERIGPRPRQLAADRNCLCADVSASSRRPSADRMAARLLSDRARSDVNASGRIDVPGADADTFRNVDIFQVNPRCLQAIGIYADRTAALPLLQLVH
jgi:hypothetical protein